MWYYKRYQKAVNANSIIGDTISLRTKAQLRAARALLEWSQAVLAENSGISLPTIKRLEPGDGPLVGQLSTITALERALEAAGVEFTNGGQPGVRMKAASDSSETLDQIAEKIRGARDHHERAVAIAAFRTACLKHPDGPSIPQWKQPTEMPS